MSFELWHTNQNDERVLSATYPNPIGRRDRDPTSNRWQCRKRRSACKVAEAERAKEMNIVNRVAPEGKALAYAEKYAEMIKARPSSGIRGQKETVLDTVAGGNLDKVLRDEGYRAMSFHDTDAWQTLPKAFAEGEFPDDMDDCHESLDEAFEDV